MNKGGLMIRDRGWSQVGQSPKALNKNAQKYGLPSWYLIAVRWRYMYCEADSLKLLVHIQGSYFYEMISILQVTSEDICFVAVIDWDCANEYRKCGAWGTDGFK